MMIFFDNELGFSDSDNLNREHLSWQGKNTYCSDEISDNQGTQSDKILDSNSSCGKSKITEEDADSTQVPAYACIECGKTFASSKSVNRHAKTRHGATVFSYYSQIKCPCCPSEFSIKCRLEEHLEKEHNIVLQKEKHTFHNQNEFKDWKKKEERENICMFVKKSGGHKNGVGATVSYFYCHRSGSMRRIRKQRRRNMKWMGSNKINYTCPAMMKVVEIDGKILVEYTKNHVGHTNDIQRIHLKEDNPIQLNSAVADDFNNNDDSSLSGNNADVGVLITGEKSERTELEKNIHPQSLNSSGKMDRHKEEMLSIFNDIGREIFMCSSTEDVQEWKKILKRALASFKAYKKKKVNPHASKNMSRSNSSSNKPPNKKTRKQRSPIKNVEQPNTLLLTQPMSQEVQLITFQLIGSGLESAGQAVTF